LLVAAVALAGSSRAASAQTISSLTGDHISVTVIDQTNSATNYDLVVPFLQTLGDPTNPANPRLELDDSGDLNLKFRAGIVSTNDFVIWNGIELAINKPNTYFGEDVSNNIIFSESPIPENGVPDISPSFTIGNLGTVEYNACLAAANNVANQPIASLVNSQIFINIPPGASAPAFCDITFKWHINAISDTNCPIGFPGCVHGDPQFTGFLGQSYQVHGVSGQVYNVLSTPRFQYNALFTYLDEGKCRKGTPCFSHAGNYFGEVGLLLRSPTGAVSVLRAIAGPVDTGLQVLLDNETVNVSSTAIAVGDSSITFANPFELVIESPEFSMKLSNSDMFINQDVAINNSLMKQIQEFKQSSKSGSAPELLVKLPHGLLGQTWQRKTYNNRWKYIEGTLFEYSVNDGVTGTQFKYNRF